MSNFHKKTEKTVKDNILQVAKTRGMRIIGNMFYILQMKAIPILHYIVLYPLDLTLFIFETNFSTSKLLFYG